MNKTELKLINGHWENYGLNKGELQIVYDNEEEANEIIYFMNRSQLANWLVQNIDFTWDVYGGGDSGEELIIETNVCLLPQCKETYITKDDYNLLYHNDLLEEAAELINNKGGN